MSTETLDFEKLADVVTEQLVANGWKVVSYCVDGPMMLRGPYKGDAVHLEQAIITELTKAVAVRMPR